MGTAHISTSDSMLNRPIKIRNSESPMFLFVFDPLKSGIRNKYYLFISTPFAADGFTNTRPIAVLERLGVGGGCKGAGPLLSAISTGKASDRHRRGCNSLTSVEVIAPVSISVTVNKRVTSPLFMITVC